MLSALSHLNGSIQERLHSSLTFCLTESKTPGLWDRGLRKTFRYERLVLVVVIDVEAVFAFANQLDQFIA